MGAELRFLLSSAYLMSLGVYGERLQGVEGFSTSGNQFSFVKSVYEALQDTVYILLPLR